MEGTKNLSIKLGSVYWGLTVLFTALKLEGIITWSWLWVVSPIILQMGLFVCSLFVISVVYLIKIVLELKR